MYLRTKWVKVDGQLFKKDAAVLYKVHDERMEAGIITNIFIIGKNIIFKVKCFILSHYDRHFRVHTLYSLDTIKFVLYQNLPLHIPIHPRHTQVLPNQIVVVLPYLII